MKTCRKTVRCIVLLFSVYLLTVSVKAQAGNYIYQDIGTLGGSEAVAFDLNNNGQVVGWSTRNDNPECWSSNGFIPCRFGFLWQNGNMTDLDHLEADAEFTYAEGINDNGIIIGYDQNMVEYSLDYTTLPFLYDYHGMQALPLLDSGENGNAKDINQCGVVVGYSDDANGYQTIVTWKEGAIQEVMPPTADFHRRGTGINYWGSVAGIQLVPKTGENMQAICHKGNTLKIMVDNEYFWSEAVATNDFGVIVGNSTEHVFREGRAALWFPLAFGYYIESIVGPGTEYNRSSFNDVNNWGHAVGYAEDDNGELNAIFYDGIVSDLNHLVQIENVHFAEAHAINNRGDIVGMAIVDGVRRAFLLTRH